MGGERAHAGVATALAMSPDELARAIDAHQDHVNVVRRCIKDRIAYQYEDTPLGGRVRIHA